MRQAEPLGPIQPRILVTALGSVLMGDDGVGQAILARLEAEHELPDEVERLDLGTPGPDLADWLAGYEAVIFLDAARLPDVPPGSVRQFSRQEIARMPAGPRTSPHDPGVGEALLKAELVGEAPREAILVGVVPARVELSTELSAEVSVALPQAVSVVVEALEALGVRAPRRAEPLPTRSFWAAPAIDDDVVLGVR